MDVPDKWKYVESTEMPSAVERVKCISTLSTVC